MLKSIVLKTSRDKSILQKHPWIFSGALAKVPAGLQNGETVLVRSAEGHFLALAAWSEHSQISLRVWSFDETTAIDQKFFEQRIGQAVRRRERLGLPAQSNALRLIYGESDGLPGLIIDRYADQLVLQILSAGAEYQRQNIYNALQNVLPGLPVFERSDVDIRHREGLKNRRGTIAGAEPDGPAEINENGLKIWVDVLHGHKTGYYLDQRENRFLLGTSAKGKTVLNCFSYSGGFGLSALQGGAAHVTNLDLSTDALALLDKNMVLNNFTPDHYTNVAGDVFEVLRGYRDAGRQFDIIVLDPPKFADSRTHLPKALRGYKDINWLALRLLKPGGLLFTFSCSGLLEAPLFQKIIADAALDAGRSAQIVTRLGQSADHPVLLSFPEAAYLKGLVCQAD